MVGRTPEYLGKKIEAYDVKVSALAVLILIFDIMGFTAWAIVSQWGLAGLNNAGPPRVQRDPVRVLFRHGQQRERLRGTHRQHLLVQHDPGLSMMIGRFFFIVPVLALAGNLAKKKIVPESGGASPSPG